MTQEPVTSITSSPPGKTALRWVSLAGGVAMGLALAGFLVGIGQESSPVRSSVSEAANHPTELPAAPAYRELPERALSPNAQWQSVFTSLKQDRPGLFDVVPRTSEMKNHALRDRQRNRAFDGAPPVIPHPIPQRSSESCLVCHREGLQLADRIASRISHRDLTNCTQCHVEAESSGPMPIDFVPENQFVAMVRSGPGRRAMTGSPPTIPHSTWLRENCLSCHGLVARPGLRTTHPWLSNCVQCHAPSAELNRVPFDATQPVETLAEPRRSSTRREREP